MAEYPVCEVKDCPGYGTPHPPIEPPAPLFAAPAGGFVVELEPSHNIVIREPRLGDGSNDIVLTVGDVAALIAALNLMVEYRTVLELGES